MRYAVISDIHANLEALRAVRGRIAELGADRVLCLGDIVGYNANPNECVDIVRSEAMTCVLGNHDAVAAGLAEPDSFNPLARNAVVWTRERITEANRRFLAALPRELAVQELFLCHGSIHDTDRYLLFAGDVAENFSLLDGLSGGQRICLFGHTHAAAFYRRRGRAIETSSDAAIDVSADERYLVNPGAVGQPRDGDPRAAFLIYDSGEARLTFHRVGYDTAACQDKIIRAGLPPRLAERLSLGW